MEYNVCFVHSLANSWFTLYFWGLMLYFASKMTYIVSGGALNSTHSLTSAVSLPLSPAGTFSCICYVLVIIGFTFCTSFVLVLANKFDLRLQDFCTYRLKIFRWCLDPDTNFRLDHQRSYCSCFTKRQLTETGEVRGYIIRLQL